MTQRECIDSKIVLLGSASVGKTCIICRAVSDEFDKEIPATIGACYTSKELDIGDLTVNLQIWDTAGQERFRTLAPMYYRNSIVALLVFSVIDDHSLQDVQNWAQEMKQQTEELPILFVVANKIDLTDERRVLPEQGQAVAKELKAFYSEVSAKSGTGIDELFIQVAEESLKKLNADQSAGPIATIKQQTVSLKAEGSEKKKKCNC
jgi:Ras-related protein Rab-5C